VHELRNWSLNAWHSFGKPDFLNCGKGERKGPQFAPAWPLGIIFGFAFSIRKSAAPISSAPSVECLLAKTLDLCLVLVCCISNQKQPPINHNIRR
jgi:hypothetical protein